MILPLHAFNASRQCVCFGPLHYLNRNSISPALSEPTIRFYFNFQTVNCIGFSSVYSKNTCSTIQRAQLDSVTTPLSIHFMPTSFKKLWHESFVLFALLLLLLQCKQQKALYFSADFLSYFLPSPRLNCVHPSSFRSLIGKSAIKFKSRQILRMIA